MKAKHTLAGALALAMLASTAVSFQVSAADASVTLKGAKVEAEAGGEFSVDVSLEDIPSTKVNVMDFAVTYDQTVLNVDSVKIGKSAAVDVSGDSTASDAPVFATNIKDGEITVSWTTALDSNSWISEDGVILTITGTVKDGVADGTVTPIDFAPVTRETYDGSGKNNSSMVIGYVYGKDAASYTIKTEAGSVTVGKSGQTTTETTVTTSGEDTTETTSKTTAKTTASEAPATSDSKGSETSGGTVEGSVLYGDVNSDGRVDITDAVMLNKVVAGAVTLDNAVQRKNADCNGDGEVTGSDSTVLLQFLVSIINTLPYSD
ncbi:MAG: cohesin domain-containing protein [Ruminococcus callidus]